MELDIKEFLAICVILVIFGGINYLVFVYDNQSSLINIQGKVISEQSVELNEKDSILEQEKLLNEDKDGDGLTLREERSLMTFDTNIDSDGDSVPDKYDEHPMTGGRMIVKHLEWDYSGKHWTYDLPIPSDVITYYEQKPRPRWASDYSYFSEFIDVNDKGVEILASGLQDFIDQYSEIYKWDYYDKVMFVVSMVRQLHYISDVYVGFDEFTKFPMQTLNDGTGDCEDMAILSAAILKKLNYDVKLLYLDIPDRMNHVAIAVLGDISGTYFERDNKKYFYVETIAKYNFGEFPSQWVGGEGILIDLKE